MGIMKGEAFFSDASFPFFIQRYRIGKGETIPTHTHDFVEFVYVVEGDALHEMAEHRYALSTGDVFVLEPQTYHSYIASEVKDTVVYNILFQKKLLQKEIDVLLKLPAFINFFYLAPFLRKNASFIPYISLKETQRMQIETHLQKMLEEFTGQPIGHELIIKTRWIECLVMLSRFQEENEKQYTGALGHEEWMESILHFVRQHYRQSLTLAQLSRTCGMSIASFTNKFKKATGMSFIDYKHSLQIKHACELLRDPRNKILFVAFGAGFQDVSFFNRIFRKHVGMTPKEYRRLQNRG